MSEVDLRPMTLGEVLDRTFKLYKNNFLLFAGITAWPFLVLLVINIGIAGSGLGARPAAGTMPPSGMLPSMIVGAITFGLLYRLHGCANLQSHRREIACPGLRVAAQREISGGGSRAMSRRRMPSPGLTRSLEKVLIMFACVKVAECA